MSGTTHAHKPSFWNGWDFKTLVLIGGIVFNVGYNTARFDNLSDLVKDFKQETKEQIKDLYDKLGNKADKTSMGGK